jgi:hypothetical protein
MCGSRQGYEMAAERRKSPYVGPLAVCGFWPGGLHGGAQARPSITPKARRSTASRQQKETE